MVVFARPCDCWHGACIDISSGTILAITIQPAPAQRALRPEIDSEVPSFAATDPSTHPYHWGRSCALALLLRPPEASCHKWTEHRVEQGQAEPWKYVNCPNSEKYAHMQQTCSHL